MSEWMPGKISIRHISAGIVETSAEIYVDLFAVHKDIQRDGDFSKKIVGTTHLPSGLSMRNAIGVYYDYAEAKKALEIAARVQNNWRINCDTEESDLNRIQKRVMEAIREEFGNAPFKRLKKHLGPGRPIEAYWMNGTSQ